MTPVFGHGRLRLYLLKLLDESPRHGYEIIQQLRERFAGLYAPSAGTVYPRLARLESEGLIRHETDGGRKVYRITDAGRAELAAKAGELDALESEIRDSVRDLAEGIREEVRESARTVREELEAQAREAAQEMARQGRGSRRGGPSFPFTPPTPLAPGGPPPESADWTRDQWRDWKRAQQEQWREWKQEMKGQTDQWKDWQRAWKDQWAHQWKEQWEQQWEEQRRAWEQSGPPPWKQWAGSFFGPQEGFGGSGGSGSGGESGSRRGMDWEVFGPQLRDLFTYLSRNGAPLVDAARRHGPLSEDDLAQAYRIIDQTLRDLRDLFDSPRDARPDDPAE
ncbi:MAG TPA: PadR family transcriptional regulator [Actinocrinis sp.]|jgi:DNA-binding PadR family transcriptional regulator|uniref:PadR family transcriptional regulator n=1 Tax=Actinocrinis sp. TaxID=1920516 RepID=UPI002DDD60C6|nr:PadR family transcriptional regulator [Actinocrinis sp.]HEV3169815.1 PadR family transcriptional regulator [Actinocrinis sp.]